MGKMKEAWTDLICAIDDGAQYIDLFEMFPNASSMDIYEAWVSVHGDDDNDYCPYCAGGCPKGEDPCDDYHRDPNGFYNRDHDDSMDGDHESALASAGWGTDEDYGDFGSDEY